MKDMTLSPAQVDQFASDGYLFVPELLDSEETAMLFAAARNDTRIREHSFFSTRTCFIVPAPTIAIARGGR